MKEIINAIENEKIEELILSFQSEEWDIKIEDDIQQIIERNNANILCEAKKTLDDASMELSITGQIGLLEEHKFPWSGTSWTLKYATNNMSEMMFSSCNFTSNMNAYLQKTINFNNFFTLFGYEYRKYKANASDVMEVILSFVVKDDSKWNVDFDYYDFEPIETYNEMLYVDVYNKKNHLEVVFHEWNESCSINCYSDCGINTSVPGNYRLKYKGGTIPLSSFIKMKLNRMAEEDPDMAFPDWLDMDDINACDNNLKISIEDVIVRTTKYKCAFYGHNLERIKAVVTIMTGTGIINKEVDAMYCNECDEYYITESEYNKLRKIGVLCHKTITEKEYIQKKTDYSNWAEKSILSQFGYSVNDQDALTENERHNIIKLVIGSGQMSPEQVVSHLEWLVRKRGERCTNAKVKWEDDINYIKRDLDVSKIIEVRNLFRKEYELLQ